MLKLSLRLTSRQQETILEECLCLINGSRSELFGSVIRGSPRESLGAGWRSCNPSDHWCSRAASYLGTQNLLLESSKIINFLKLNVGVLESRHSLLQYW